MPSEPSDGIFDALAVSGAGRTWKYPNRHPRQHRNLETRHSRQHRNLETRHSRAGGNPDLSVQKLIGYNGFLRFRILDSRLRGNDGIGLSAFHLP
ncbi:hypothetical protein NEILACOT_05732, partial [Neisseria lactamica ATCC 23970]